ncbi:MAG: glycosyltransferase [Ruminococcus sp.]
MDVFLFPSLFEGLPFTLLEAQANGLPCVISDQITGEAVLSQENVTMISLAESPEKWAKAVFKMKEAGRIEREEAPEGWQKQDLTSMRKGRS